MKTKDTRPSSTISPFLQGTLIGAVAGELSDEHNFPLQTANFAALIVASHIVGACYCIESPGDKVLPVPLFGITEQPSNAGKTIVVEDLYEGYNAQAGLINFEIAKKRRTIKQSITKKLKSGDDLGLEEEQAALEKLVEIPVGISDPTPEGLETSLVDSGGFFMAYSTEQGLSKTLLGGIYSEGKTKDDLVLKAFNAEHHKVVRAGKDVQRFCGFPYGGVLEISQEGTIQRIMEKASSTGIAERFLIMREDDLLGTRQYLKTRQDLLGLACGQIKPDKNTLAALKRTDMVSTAVFKKKMAMLADLRSKLESPRIKDGLIRLRLSDEAMIVKLAAKQLIEDEIGKELIRNSYLASMKGKIDLQIMKVAATLHVTDWDEESLGKIDPIIPADTVNVAFEIIYELVMGVSRIADGNNLYGDRVESAYILEYMVEANKPQSLEQMKRNIPRKKDNPFKFYKGYGEAPQKIEQAIDRLVTEGKVIKNDKRTPITYFAKQ